APQSQWGVNLFPPLVETDTSYTTPITATNNSGGAATLEGWIDFNHSGTFDAGEKTTVAVPNGTSGAVSLNWTSLPADMSYGTTFIRLRLTNDSTGAGEVEDHVIGIALAVPPESPSVSVMSGETVRACQVVVFQDDFDDLADGIYLSPNRAGSATIRDWTTTGGGEDTYARITTQSASDRVVYLGNGFVRRITPSITSLGGSLSFDANGRLTSVINGIELRSGPDDSSPGVTQNDSSWGPDEVVFSRTFPSVAGKVYRLYFTAVPESGSYSEGMMRIDTPVGSAHFRAPASGSGDINYAIEFTATSNSSTIAVANYGHIGGTSGDWCNPQHADPAGAPWCTQEGVTSGSGTNEVSVDDIYLVEAACDSDTSDTPADGSAAPAGGTTAYGTASHDIVSGIQLGAAIDADTASIASPNADGDGADDDGVTLPTLTQGASATITTTISGAGGYLQAWIDWNGDGDFADTVDGISEQISINAQDNTTTVPGRTDDSDTTAGQISIAVSVPPSATTSQTFARFRWSTDLNLNATDAASDGEVEDYAITITAGSAGGPVGS
ncbi:MAG: GEVED domain-containing protein, partial [Thiolinea sp.]